jgi:hypothetical protein
LLVSYLAWHLDCPEQDLEDVKRNLEDEEVKVKESLQEDRRPPGNWSSNQQHSQ